MSEKFVSSNELRKLLSKATIDERLALTKIVDTSQTKPYESNKLQKEICLFGGHGVANWFRDSGTGYLDIVDDAGETLGLDHRDSYSSKVKYYDEIMYIKNERHDTPESKINRLYDRGEATRLGNEYAVRNEKEIIIKVMENAYSQMKKDKEKTKKELQAMLSRKHECEKKIPANKSASYDLLNKLNSLRSELSKIQDSENNTYIRLSREIQSLEKKRNQLARETKNLTAEFDALPTKIKAKEAELKEAIQRLENFDNHLSQTIRQYDASSMGAITGTAGLMALANLGGFATYTFLTSMMSTLSFGTLGFGAYTAATSFLSVVIGPVGWAGLGLWAIFSLGKPDESKVVLIVATLGMIRQRILFESNQSFQPNIKSKNEPGKYEHSKKDIHPKKVYASAIVKDNKPKNLVPDHYVLVSEFAKEAKVLYQDVHKQIKRGILRSKVIDRLLYVHIGDLDKIETRIVETKKIVRNVDENHLSGRKETPVYPSEPNTWGVKYRLIPIIGIVCFLLWVIFSSDLQPHKDNPTEASASISSISNPVSKDDWLMHVTAKALNVREQPNTQSKIFGYLSQYQDVNIISNSNAGWAYVRAKGLLLEGYVSTNYLEEGSGESVKISIQ